MGARLQAQTTWVFIFKVVRNIYARVFPPWQKTAVPILHFRGKNWQFKKKTCPRGVRDRKETRHLLKALL